MADNKDYIRVIDQNAREKVIFDKLIKPLQGIDLFDEYIKIRLKISTLSASKRNAVLTHILTQYNTNKEVEEFIDRLDKAIIASVRSNFTILK